MSYCKNSTEIILKKPIKLKFFEGVTWAKRWGEGGGHGQIGTSNVYNC